MNGFRLARILGFEIRVDLSWFVILILILWSFSAVVFPLQYPELTPGAHAAMGGAATLLFFASLLTHEISHSIVARRRGIPVEGITLFIFGGVSRTRAEAESPADEFAIAAAGPLASLGIALAFAVVSLGGGLLGVGSPVVGVARYLAYLNAALAIFNLLPGFPLDGGRLFRALVWKLTGDLTTATRWASAAGAGLGYGLMALGVLQLFAGATLGGLWLLFIGWFLRNAAASSLHQHLVRGLLSGVTARELMTPDPDVLEPDLTIREAVDAHFLARRHQAFPVVEDGRVIGLLSLNRVKTLPRDLWPSRTVREVMRPIEDLVVRPGDPVTSVLEAMEATGERRALVLDGDRLAGIVSPSDVTSWIQRSQELEPLREPRTPAGREGS